MPVYYDKLTIDEQEIVIAIEVDKIEDVDSPYQDLRGGKKVIRAVRDLFGDGMSLAKNCAIRVVKSINDMQKAIKPDEFQLQFGIKLDAEAGAIIAKTEAGAQLQITMTWKNKE